MRSFYGSKPRSAAAFFLLITLIICNMLYIVYFTFCVLLIPSQWLSLFLNCQTFVREEIFRWISKKEIRNSLVCVYRKAICTNSRTYNIYHWLAYLDILWTLNWVAAPAMSLPLPELASTWQREVATALCGWRWVKFIIFLGQVRDAHKKRLKWHATQLSCKWDGEREREGVRKRDMYVLYFFALFHLCF